MCQVKHQYGSATSLAGGVHTNESELRPPSSSGPTLLSLVSKASFAPQNSLTCACRYGLKLAWPSCQAVCASASPTMPSWQHRFWHVLQRLCDGAVCRHSVLDGYYAQYPPEQQLLGQSGYAGCGVHQRYFQDSSAGPLRGSIKQSLRPRRLF